MYEYLGLFMIIITWITGVLLLNKWKGTHDMSISQHAASDPIATRFFAAVMIIVGTIFYIWLATWFLEKLNFGSLFLVLITVIFVAQIITSLTPDRGRTSIAHKAAAYFLAFMFIPFSFVILNSPYVSDFAKVASIAGILYMLVAFLLFIFVKKLSKFYLFFQVIYILAFQLIIITAAYT